MAYDWLRRASGLLVPTALGFADNPMGRWHPCGVGCCPIGCQRFPDCTTQINGPIDDAIFTISGVNNLDCDFCDVWNDTHSVPLLTLWVYGTFLDLSCTSDDWNIRTARLICAINCAFDGETLVCRLSGLITINFDVGDPGPLFYSELHSFHLDRTVGDPFDVGENYDLDYQTTLCRYDLGVPGIFACDAGPNALSPVPEFCDFSGASFNIEFATP